MEGTPLHSRAILCQSISAVPISAVTQNVFSKLISNHGNKTVAEAYRTSGQEGQSLTLDVSPEAVNILDIVLATFVIMEAKKKRKHDHHSPTHAGEEDDPKIPHNVASLVNGSGMASTAVRDMNISMGGVGIDSGGAGVW